MAATATPKSKAPGPLIPGAKVMNAGNTSAKVTSAKKADPKTQAARERIKALDPKPSPEVETKELPWDQQVDPKSGPLPEATPATATTATEPVKEKKARKPRTPKDPSTKAVSVADKFAEVLRSKGELLSAQAKEIASLKKELKAAKEAHKADLKKVAALGKAKVRKPRKPRAEKS